MAQQGIRWVITALTLGLGLAAMLDIYFAARHWRSVGSRIHTWARHFPLLAGLLLFLLGALMAHFFLNSDV
jgi:hypothetical protein